MTEFSATVRSKERLWQQHPLLGTKLYVPPTPSRFVLRPRLVKQLEEGMQTRLSLICAAAGFGKTSLLSEFCAHLSALTTSRCPIAWVSLDSDDNDPVRFWRYVLVALAQIQPGSEDILRPLLETVEAPAPDYILTTLINAIFAFPGKVVLVLDDYHTITTPSIHQNLMFLLDHLPPPLHIILASRTDPPLSLSRLRSRGQLNELRTDDLRFTLPELIAFLETATELAFSEEMVQVLEQRTEGWIAGLNLAALSLRGRTDSTAFIKDFAGSHRYILDYLSEEVLRQQPPSMQLFLQQTSLLERLSAPLCNAVTQQNNSQEVLEQLEQENLFIIPLDDERGWYRYHHLFSEVLRRQLQSSQPEHIPVLHSRAATWYEHEGLINEAISHTLATADYGLAARLIERVAPSMLLSGERRTLQQWLLALPQEVVHRHPRLCITSATLLASSSVRLEAVELYLQLAEARLLEDPGDATESQVQEMLGEIYGIRANTARHAGDILRAIPLFEQALHYIPQENAFQRAYVSLNLGASLIYSGKVESTLPILHEAVKMGQAAGSLYILMQAFHRLIWTQVIHGELHQAYDSSQRALHYLEASGKQERSPHGGVISVIMGDILREWNDLDASEQALKRGIEECEQVGELVLLGVGYLYLAHVKLAQGELDEAENLLQTVDRLVQHRSTTIPFSSRIPFYRVRLQLAQGNLNAAVHLIRERHAQMDSLPGYLYTLEYLTFVRVLLAEAKAETTLTKKLILEEALAITGRMYQAAKADGRGNQVIEALILQALVLQAQDNLPNAVKCLTEALALAEPQGYIRLFVDEGTAMAALLKQVYVEGIAPTYVATLLAAFGMPQTVPERVVLPPPVMVPSSELLEPLSDRELDVLRLIVAGQSNDEVAQTLVVSTGTVKTHLRHIYGKLDVHTRTQAIARAHELRLLSS